MNVNIDDPKILKAFSDANRLMIINTLFSGEQSSGKLAKRLNISSPSLSRHIKVLSSLGLILSRNEKNQVYYRLNDDVLKSFQPFLSDLISSTKSFIL